MKRLLVVLLACLAAFAAVPERARAGECGLPEQAAAALDRLRRRQRPVLADVRQAGRDRRGGQLHLPPAPAGDGRQDRLLGDEPEAACRHAHGADQTGAGRGLGRPDLLPGRRLHELRPPVDGPERDVGREPPHPLVADECAVPRERPELRAPPLGARSPSLPAPFDAPVHRRRGRRLVARDGAVHDVRPRDLRARSGLPPPGAGPRQPQPAPGLPLRDHRADRDRRAHREDRAHPRIPYEPGHRRPRRAQADECVVQPHQAPGAGRQAGIARAAVPDDLVVGLGRVGPERSRSRQAGSRLRLALDAQPHALQRPGHGRPGLRRITDRRPAAVPTRRPVQDPVGERLVARRGRRSARDGGPRGGAVVAVRPRRPHRSDARHEQGVACGTAHRHRLAFRGLHRGLPHGPWRTRARHGGWPGASSPIRFGR